MNFTQSFKLALKSLRTSKMRSFLTMLGIIIGVGAVIIIISLGNGLKSMVDQQVERVGITQIYTYTWGLGDGTTGNVSPEEMYEVVESRPDLFEGITPWVSAGQGIRIGGEEYPKTSIYGVSEAMYRPATGTTLDGGALARGRYLQYVDVATERKVCVVGAYVEQALLGGDALGKTVSIQGVPYTVVGVLAQNSETMTEGGGDDQLYIPYANAMRLSGSSYVSLYQITAVSRDAVSQAQTVLMDFLRDFYHDTDGSLVYSAYYVQTMLEQVELINTMMGVAMMVLVAIAAISLLVGGIGIMNIMLVSVTERTRHPQVPGRQAAGYPPPVHHRGGHYLRHRWIAGHRLRVSGGHGCGHAHRRHGGRPDGRRRHLYGDSHGLGCGGELRGIRGHRRAVRLPARQQGRLSQPHRRPAL